jgi:hypothetical protein
MDGPILFKIDAPSSIQSCEIWMQLRVNLLLEETKPDCCPTVNAALSFATDDGTEYSSPLGILTLPAHMNVPNHPATNNRALAHAAAPLETKYL